MRLRTAFFVYTSLLTAGVAGAAAPGLADIEIVGPGGTPADLVGERPAVLYITTPRVEDVPQRMPLLEFLYEELGGKINVGLVIYGEDPKNLVKFREGMPYPIYAAAGAIPPDLWGEEQAVPLTLFFDKNGEISERRVRSGVPDPLDVSKVLDVPYDPGSPGPPAEGEPLPRLVLVGTDDKYHNVEEYGLTRKKTLVYLLSVEDEDRERRLTRLQYLQDDLGGELNVVPVLLDGVPAAAAKLADAYALDLPLLVGGPLIRHRLAGESDSPVLLMFDDDGLLSVAKAGADVPDRNEIAAEESLPPEEGPPIPYVVRYTVRVVTGLGATAVPVSTWSASGERIIFSGRFAGQEYDSLYEISRAGKKLRRITTAEADDVHPTASPTGNLIFFSSTRTGAEELWRCERTKGEFTRITKYFDRASAPSFSNDGALIVYERPAAGGNDLWLATPDGRRARPADETYFDENDGYVWGDRVFFESDRYGDADIFSCDVTGGKRHRLTADEAADLTPTVSPDGRYVVWASDRAGDFDLWVMNADGSNKIQLTRGPGDDLYPRFSPSGREISFTRVLGDTAEIYKLTFEALPDYDGPRPPRPLAGRKPS
jgi:hypothetical protein